MKLCLKVAASKSPWPKDIDCLDTGNDGEVTNSFLLCPHADNKSLNLQQIGQKIFHGGVNDPVSLEEIKIYA